MTYLRNSLFNITFALNCLLIFLLIFETRIDVPVWLQVVGRMHPVFLHFPLVLVIAYGVVAIILAFKKSVGEPYKAIASFLLLLAALSAVLAALAGLVLSREEGYDAEALQWHKWSGVTVSVLTLAWYYFHRRIESIKPVAALTGLFAILLVIFAGHQGAGITHGQNFLLAPMLPEKKQPGVTAEEAIVFAHMVKPILEEKCMGCHNSKKAKGELVMETEQLLLKGGKSGKLWDSTVADLGLLLRRVHLPLEAKKHMPPQGKPQLTGEETEIIAQWIRKGADFNLRVADLPPDDTLALMAVQIFTNAAIAEYDFEEADPSTVEKLNTANRVVSPEALGSPALTVNFFNSTLFSADQLKELSEIKKQIVTLDLAKMPLKDEDVKLISEFENLRRLNLSFTGVTGASLAELKKLKHLRSLSLSGTQVKAEQLKQLSGFAGLKTVYTWNLPVSEADMKSIAQQSKNIRFETGFRGDTVKLKLSPPVLMNEEAFISKPIPLKLKHYVLGASIRYTTDGSEPDSLHSPLFTGKEMIDSSMRIKAKAYKPGWVSSDLLVASIYKSTYTPDTVYYHTKYEDGFKDEDNKYLYNREKGEADYRFGNWVGFRNNHMECFLHFASPVPVSSIILSTLIDPGPYIMPAERIEIWGGKDEKKLKLLSKRVPAQPDEYIPSRREGLEFKFDTTELSLIKIVAVPVQKLPKWHQGKGEKGWFFIDEVLVN
jgi:uncharacterized membrane protein